MDNINNKIKKQLFNNQDIEYLEFISKLTPTIDKSKFIGVRVPIIRKLAKKFFAHNQIGDFLHNLPHDYVEENNIHGLIISEFNDYKKCILELDNFLPYVDNWATCDIIKPKCFKSNLVKLKKDCIKWMSDDKPFTIRFGIEMVMTYFLDENFDNSLMDYVSKIDNKDYYVKMIVAWYFATALAKQWNYAISYIKENKLYNWIHNKTIQKCIESNRISKDQKQYLRSLKILNTKE